MASAGERQAADVDKDLALLWGVQERPNRGPKPKLSLDKIVSAAVAVADAEGLEAVSMQRVAADLGYTTMSLYRYVQSKEQLVVLMADAALGRAPEPAAGADWRQRMEELVGAVMAVYRRRPWLLRIDISGPPMAPMQLTWFDAYLGALAGTRLSVGERISTVTFIDGASRELARIAVQTETARRRNGVSEAAALDAYGQTLRRFADPERYPHVAAAVAEGAFDPPPPPPASGVEEVVGDVEIDASFGLHRLLDGVESYVRAREGAQARVGQDPADAGGAEGA
ncbi:TetR/AcrR family transcriptional regulator [Streptomonospora sp. S1-112]|uniref:TetR/AcrR family transcriptional regulator n=1 Tax=Streptomonospora mangrovi TaxID=2883123 RepID=A0A9X3NRH9_9ACTN|nr:TetR/AcrR family transcriptional regulator C-terminal domain-containing protein [Streptomonospora mangrovi]MDA0566724.1 TetR/AcrR family transcriptional regulator [Streptomonospora mangrovi]